jgi:hypothetical protein
MPRKYLMSWEPEDALWRKQSKALAIKRGLNPNHRFTVSVVQLIEMGKLPANVARTAVATYAAANEWWLEQLGQTAPQTHPHQDQLEKVNARIEYARQEGLTGEAEELKVERADIEASDDETYLHLSQDARRNIEIAQMGGIVVPPDASPEMLEFYFGRGKVWQDRFKRRAFNPTPTEFTAQAQISAYLGQKVKETKAGKVSPAWLANLRYLFVIIEEQLGSSRDVRTLNEKDVTAFHSFCTFREFLHSTQPA